MDGLWLPRVRDKRTELARCSVRAVIPARGGSKGVPGKNIMERCRGQSLLAYAIACCHDAELVDSVVVSTDHDMIAEEATRCGAIVCWRPASMARDTSSVTEALRHCLAHHPADIAATVQCTSPMLSPADIRSEEHTSELQSR